MPTKLKVQFDRLRYSLRARVALGVALPVLLALVGVSLVHYWRERELIEEQVRLTAVQVGEVALGSLSHVMMEKDQFHLDQILSDVGEMENVQQIMVVGEDGHVTASNTAFAEEVLSPNGSGCIECHQIAPQERTRATILQASPDTLRISTPIKNEPRCQTCHMEELEHLGVLLLDVSLLDIRTHILGNLKEDMVAAAGLTLLITTGVYLLLDRLFVHRFEQWQQPMDALAEGDFTARLPFSSGSKDEIDTLAASVNQMASELQRQVQDQEERHMLRQNAIVEERERIAREIHDGIAQFLGYVNHKVTAIRLLLQKDNFREAETQLLQLSDASEEAFVELRGEILGLRSSEMHNGDLISSLETFSKKFSELSGVTVEVNASLHDGNTELSPETELHLIRITQEALANVHKHAQTDQAWVRIELDEQTLEISIEDHGVGFDPYGPPSDKRPHFGLKTMRERADAIGADFNVDTSPGEGTRVTVVLIMNGTA